MGYLMNNISIRTVFRRAMKKSILSSFVLVPYGSSFTASVK